MLDMLDEPAARRGSSTSAAPAACSPSGPAPPGTTSPASTYMEIPGVARAHGPVLRRRPGAGASRPRSAAGFDVVVAGDVIEHLARPGKLLQDMRAVLRPGGQLLLSVPELRPLVPAGAGRARACSATTGAASSTTPTCASSPGRRCAGRSGRPASTSSRSSPPGCRSGAIGSADPAPSRARALQRLDAALVRARPTLFGYQHVLRLVPHAEEMIYADDLDGDAHVDEVTQLTARPDRSAATA